MLCLTCKLKSKQIDFCASLEDLMEFSCNLKNSLYSASSYCERLIFQCRDHVSSCKVICIEFCIQNFFPFCARSLVAVLPNTIINGVLLGPVLRSVMSHWLSCRIHFPKAAGPHHPECSSFQRFARKRDTVKAICSFSITVYIIYKMGNYNINFSIKHFLGRL